MKLAIKNHLRDFLGIVALVVLAVGVGGYILTEQRLRFPLIEDEPKRIKLELDNAQAVQPGQGQTVRVAGVQIGQIGKVETEDGVAVVELEIEQEHDDVIREDATALLRPRTGLKDMMVEVDPGRGDVMPAGGRIESENSAPDVNPDEVLSSLDADTRPYLKLLISGAGKGLRGRGNDLSETLKRLEPLHRDLARVSRGLANRRRALRRLINRYGLLMDELGRHPSELRRLVTASRDVFDALAGEEQNISETVARLPGTLRQTERTLVRLDRMADVLRPALQALRPPIRRLDGANQAIRPFLRESTPIVRNQIRPYVRAAQPYVDDLAPAARDLARAMPDLTEVGKELNRFFNIGAYNPGGAEPPRVAGGNDVRQEGFLYWLAWTTNNGVSLFNTADAQGVFRRLTICGLGPVIGPVQLGPILRGIADDNQALMGQITGALQGQGLLPPGTPTTDEVIAAVEEAIDGLGACRF